MFSSEASLNILGSSQWAGPKAVLQNKQKEIDKMSTRLDYLKVYAGSRSEIVMCWSHLLPAWPWELSHKPRYLQAELCNPLGWGALEQHKEESHTTCSAGALVLWNGTWWPGQNLSALGYLKANDNSTNHSNRSRSILNDQHFKCSFTFFIQQNVFWFDISVRDASVVEIFL